MATDKETNFYEVHCKYRFNKLEEKVDELAVIVKNGLSHRVKRIDRLMWFTVSLVVAKFVSEFFV